MSSLACLLGCQCVLIPVTVDSKQQKGRLPLGGIACGLILQICCINGRFPCCSDTHVRVRRPGAVLKMG